MGQKPVYFARHAPVAQLDRVLVSETKGHRFDSCRARQILEVLTPLRLQLLPQNVAQSQVPHAPQHEAARTARCIAPDARLKGERTGATHSPSIERTATGKPTPVAPVKRQITSISISRWCPFLPRSATRKGAPTIGKCFPALRNDTSAATQAAPHLTRPERLQETRFHSARAAT